MSKKVDMDKMANASITGKDKLLDFVKSKMFDLIAVAVVISMILLTLGVLELREVTLKTAINIILEWIPFYLCAVLLNTNFYKKGVFNGKQKDTFTKIVDTYSDLVNKLTGAQLEYLPDFCIKYNADALRQLQEVALKRLSISYELFNEGNDKCKPLKIMTKKQLEQLYDKHIAKQICKVIKMRVKGINPNTLLGSTNSSDPTDLGQDEGELRKKRMIKYATGYIFSIGFMTLIAVKNILEWGWAGLLFAAFKILYVFARSYLRYFEGYEDIVVKVANHISRKTDILKEFVSWEENKNGQNGQKEASVTDTSVQ